MRRASCLYAICGAGSVDVIDQIDRDTYKMSVEDSDGFRRANGIIRPRAQQSVRRRSAAGKANGRTAEVRGQRRRESAFHSAMKTASK